MPLDPTLSRQLGAAARADRRAGFAPGHGLRSLACAALLVAALGACDDSPQDSDAADTGQLDASADGSDATATADATGTDATSADTTGDAATGSDTNDPGDVPDMPDTVEPAPDFANVLDDPSAFADLVDAEGTVKYLINVDGAEVVPPLSARCTFQNSLRFEFHIQFLRAFPELADLTFEEYTDWVLVPETRVWWGGIVDLYPATPHPNGGLGVMIYTVYSDPSGTAPLTAANLAEVQGALSECIPWASDLLVFVPENPTQLQQAQAIAGELDAAGVAFLPYQQLIDRWSSQSVVSGAATGTLRIVPSGPPPSDVGPSDIVLLADGLSGDPGVTAGAWITSGDPDAAFIAAAEAAGSPVAVLASGLDNDVLAAFDGHPVRVTVDGAGLTLVPAR